VRSGAGLVFMLKDCHALLFMLVPYSVCMPSDMLCGVKSEASAATHLLILM